MKNRILRISIAVMIIVLFFGASVLPSTVGINEEKITIKTLGSRGYIQDLIDNASDGDSKDRYPVIGH